MPRPTTMLRTRWAALGAAVAVTLGAGGLAGVEAAQPSEERSIFVPISPCRIVDTRAGSTVGPRDQPLGAADTHRVLAHGTNGDCTIPTDAVALSLNVTAIGASAPTFLTVWPDGGDRPEASSLNPQPGAPPTPNAVTTELSASGMFSMFNLQGVVDVLVDVNGYYADHDHDDRYPTRAEIDARSSGDVVAMGFLNAAGPTIQDGRTRPGVTVGATNPVVGRIELTITGADTDDVPIVLVTPHNGAAAARTCISRSLQTVNATTYTVRFDCYDAAGAPVTTSFQYLIAD